MTGLMEAARARALSAEYSSTTKEVVKAKAAEAEAEAEADAVIQSAENTEQEQPNLPGAAGLASSRQGERRTRCQGAGIERPKRTNTAHAAIRQHRDTAHTLKVTQIF